MQKPVLAIAVLALATVFSAGLAAQKTTHVHPGQGGSRDRENFEA